MEAYIAERSCTGLVLLFDSCHSDSRMTCHFLSQVRMTCHLIREGQIGESSFTFTYLLIEGESPT